LRSVADLAFVDGLAIGEPYHHHDEIGRLRREDIACPQRPVVGIAVANVASASAS
jgi:hypothetical protein